MYCRCDYISLKCKLSWKWVATLALLEKNESNTMAAKSRRVTADWRHFGLWSQRHLLHISADAVEADFCCCLTGALPVGKGRQMEVVLKKHDRALRITQSLRALVGLFCFQTFYTKNLKKLERTQKRKSMYVPSLSEGPHTMPRSIKSMNWNHWIHVTVTARSLTLSALKRSLCFWLWIPTVTRHTGCLGAYRWLQHLVAVHQVAVVLISRLGIHNGDIWNDGNWGRKKKKGVNDFSWRLSALGKSLSQTYWTAVWLAAMPSWWLHLWRDPSPRYSWHGPCTDRFVRSGGSRSTAFAF